MAGRLILRCYGLTRQVLLAIEAFFLELREDFPFIAVQDCMESVAEMRHSGNNPRTAPLLRIPATRSIRRGLPEDEPMKLFKRVAM